MHLGDISCTRRAIGDFVLNFVAMATGLVVVEFDGHYSIANPRLPPTRRKWHRDIFYTSGVCFVSIFVAMATRVGRCKIWLTSLMITCPGEPPGRRKRLGDISYRRRDIGDFALNFVAVATGLVVVEFIWHHSMAHPRIPPTRHSACSESSGSRDHLIAHIPFPIGGLLVPSLYL